MSHREPAKGRHQRKRKADLDQDTSAEGARNRERRREREEKEKEQSRRSHSGSSSPDPPPKKERKSDRSGDKKSEESGGGGEESISIEETNKLRVKLGLAPLEVDDKPKVRDSESGDPKEKIVNEDGFEFTHKAADNWAEKKRHAEVKEKIETLKEKRKVYEKVSKVKGLAEDEDVSAAAWVEKSRKIEEERRLAEQRAKTLQEMDEEFGIDNLIEETKKKVAQKKAKAARQQQYKSDLAGLAVEHSKEAFLEGKEIVLVLKDKGVLDDGEEVLVNPNIVDDERARKNIELRKKKPHYKPYDDEEVDDFGMVKKKNLLDKYDDELTGETRETFRLDESGSLDIDKETQMLEIKRRLHAAAKNEQSLEQPKFAIASEYFTAEEMTAFKKPKKKTKKDKIRKRGALKADDLVPAAIDAVDEGDFGSRSRGKGRKKEAYEEGEKNGDAASSETNKPKPKLQIDDDEDDFDRPDEDLTGVTIDDEAEDELASVLDKARKLKQKHNNGGDPTADNAAEMAVRSVSSMPLVKEEPMEEDAVSGTESGAVVLDATSEYCRNLGEIPTYGLAGNRLDGIDVDELMDETEAPPDVKAEDVPSDDDEETSAKKAKRGARHKEVAEDEYEQAIRHAQESSKGKWVEASTESGRPSFGKQAPAATAAASSSKAKKPDDSDQESDEEEDGKNVLGEEADVTKGVGAMLKLAAQKGYLDDSRKKLPPGVSLKHLQSRRYVQVEASKHDNDDAKYTKKLERLGAAGSGPVRPFAEMRDYKPVIRINYTDGKGHEMDAKDAFRQLSWKFHGKGPGKKQIEKRTRGMMKKELMKQMNSMDTPLGTLDKQLKKQEKLQMPYLVLSGSSKESGAPLKKE